MRTMVGFLAALVSLTACCLAGCLDRESTGGQQGVLPPGVASGAANGPVPTPPAQLLGPVAARTDSGVVQAGAFARAYQAPPNVMSPAQIPGPPPGYNEQLAYLHQRINSAEEDRKVLQARAEQLRVHLRDKDRALVQATQEVQETTQQITRMREELQRWKQEMVTLRNKLQGVERENRDTLQAIIRTLEQFLERERGGVSPTETPVLEQRR